MALTHRNDGSKCSGLFNELKALKWATDFLIPTDMLLDVIRKGIASTLADLADYFHVIDEFLMKKLEFMARQKQVWEIDKTRALCLHKLPSVIIYEKMGGF